MRRSGLLLLALITLAAGAPAQTRDTKTLDIYVADTEGGKAALFVISGRADRARRQRFPGARDADRIAAMLTEAGIKQIDCMLSTHYHLDHVGGIERNLLIQTAAMGAAEMETARK